MPNLLSQIDALLPQTQCGLCHYSGCRPYAAALAKGEAEINLCPPGGVETLEALWPHCCIKMPHLIAQPCGSKKSPPSVPSFMKKE